MIVDININEIPESQKKLGRKGNGPVQKEILKFFNGSSDSAEVVLKRGQKPAIVSTVYRNSAKSLGIPVSVIQRSSRVFLIRGNPEK